MVNIMVRWLMIPLLVCSFPNLNTELRTKKGWHPFYLSMIEIKHNAKEKTAEVSIRIFTEDLENTLKKYGNTRSDLLKSINKAAVDRLLNDYIQHKLQIQLNDKAVSLHYIGYEQQSESIWTYLEVTDIPIIKKVSVNCSLLYDYQDQQINIFHIKANGKEKTFKLAYPQTSFYIINQ